MAYDKVVDSAKLDADLTMVADAIRARAGISERLAFPMGMKDAVEGIEDESASIVDSMLNGQIQEITNSNVTSLRGNAFASCYGLKKVAFPNVITVNGAAFQNCVALSDFYLPKVETTGNNTFQGCAMVKLDLPSAKHIGHNSFQSCKNLEVLILRNSELCSIGSPEVFTRTPFASDGTGGTVYVPSALIAQYQTETNWSTLYAAGTCNFVAIEGSEYE